MRIARYCFGTILFGLAATVLIIAASPGADQVTYDPHGKRDPMVPLIGQDKPGGVLSFAEIASVDDVKLEGIAGEDAGKTIGFDRPGINISSLSF